MGKVVDRFLSKKNANACLARLKKIAAEELRKPPGQSLKPCPF